MRAVVLAVGLALFPVVASAQTPPPVEAFGRLPAVADAAISPDGRRVALAMSPADGAPFINVFDLEQRQSIFAARVDDLTQLRGVGWTDNEHVSFLISRAFSPQEVLPGNIQFSGAPRRINYFRNGIVDLATGEMRILIPNDREQWQDAGTALIAPIEGDPGFGRMIGFRGGLGQAGMVLYRVNLATGVSRETIAPGGTNDARTMFLDSRGEPALRIDSNDATNRWRVYTFDDGRARVLVEGVSQFGDPLDVQGFLPDGRVVAFDDDGGEFDRVYALDRANGQRALLFERPGNDVDSAIFDPWTHDVVGVSWTGTEGEQHFFDADLQRVYEAASTAINAKPVLVSWSQDRSRIVLWIEVGLDGGGYYVFTPATNALLRISMAYPELSSAQIGERQSITYRARDGTRIPAYLTLPAGERRNMPLVLLPHGGPASRDTMAFDWWASFLASRGYAVLQPNFRGSSGYGATWQRAGYGEWGGLMQTDLEDGVVALARTGMIDAGRVCIVGASYGGYAALAGAALTPDRYKCAVSIAGVTDLALFLDQRMEQTGDDSGTSDYWQVSIGHRQDDRELLRGRSPAQLAERVQIPILIMHGTDDSVVSRSQSLRMVDRLRDEHKDVRYVELRGDDHWLSDAPTRIQMLRELETFLAQNLQAAPSAP